MKKVLYLSLIVFPIFSMQLDVVSSKNKMNRFQEKLSKHISSIDKVHIKPASVFAPDRLGSVELYHGKKGFCVIQDDKKHIIKKYFTDPMVRDITKKQLKSFLEGGYFSLNQMEDGEFSLKAKGRINGGGPIFGKFMYWATKTTCYAVMFAGATTIALRGGNRRGGRAVSGAASGYAAYEIGTVGYEAGVQMGAGTMYGVGTSALAVNAGGILGAGIANQGYGPECALATGATMVVATPTTVVGGIEAISLAVGLFFGMLPTP